MSDGVLLTISSAGRFHLSLVTLFLLNITPWCKVDTHRDGYLSPDQQRHWHYVKESHIFKDTLKSRDCGV